MTNQNASKIEFQKPTESGPVRCVLETCDDGSVYVKGDEIEMIFELAHNNLENATRHVEDLGYVRCHEEER
ncbi:MAG: hypothetical protein DWQ31_06690 [Planctomycetota bacterium]|nr:MAG: hypothetical protein DWQ31_06690 [Planctomycetota bacterium]REJ90337.1 MAG: hypothetical protein DWQ35_16815 [Planctomycetota bacterium]